MRIASLAPSVTYMLQEMGAENMIVACTHLCPVSTEFKKSHAVGTFTTLDASKLKHSQPDIIITATIVQQKGSEELTAEGYTVLHFDPRRLIDIAESYAILGDRIGKHSEGVIHRNRFLQDVQHIQVRHTRYRPRVYLEEWNIPPFVSGNWVPDMVEAAGGEAVLAIPGLPSQPVTGKMVKEADPDMIIQHVCTPPEVVRNRQRDIEQLINRSGWEEVRAVKEGRVYALDDSPFNMPTSGVLRGIELLKQIFSRGVAAPRAMPSEALA